MSFKNQFKDLNNKLALEDVSNKGMTRLYISTAKAIDTVNSILSDETINEELEYFTSSMGTIILHRNKAKSFGARYKHNFDEEIEKIINALNSYEFGNKLDGINILDLGDK